jgi:hypothetical protein
MQRWFGLVWLQFYDSGLTVAVAAHSNKLRLSYSEKAGKLELSQQRTATRDNCGGLCFELCCAVFSIPTCTSMRAPKYCLACAVEYASSYFRLAARYCARASNWLGSSSDITPVSVLMPLSSLHVHVPLKPRLSRPVYKPTS